MRYVAYIDPSVVDHLTGRTPRNTGPTDFHQATREWWRYAPERFNLIASMLVLADARADDPDVVRVQSEVLKAVKVVEFTPEAEDLTDSLLREGAVSSQEADVAAQVATAVANSADFFVSCIIEHVDLSSPIGTVCRKAGYDELPVICTPCEFSSLGYDIDDPIVPFIVEIRANRHAYSASFSSIAEMFEDMAVAFDVADNKELRNAVDPVL